MISADNGTVTVKFNRALVDEDLAEVNKMTATAKDGDKAVTLTEIKVDPAAVAGDKEVKMTFTALTNDTAKDMNVVVTVEGKDAKAFVVEATKVEIAVTLDDSAKLKDGKEAKITVAKDAELDAIKTALKEVVEANDDTNTNMKLDPATDKDIISGKTVKVSFEATK